LRPNAALMAQLPSNCVSAAEEIPAKPNSIAAQMYLTTFTHIS